MLAQQEADDFGIIKVLHPISGYTLVPNEFIYNDRLPRELRQMTIEIAAHSPNWRTSKRTFLSMGTGQRKAALYMKQLRDEGNMFSYRKRDGGKFGKIVNVICLDKATLRVYVQDNNLADLDIRLTEKGETGHTVKKRTVVKTAENSASHQCALHRSAVSAPPYYNKEGNEKKESTKRKKQEKRYISSEIEKTESANLQHRVPSQGDAGLFSDAEGGKTEVENNNNPSGGVIGRAKALTDHTSPEGFGSVFSAGSKDCDSESKQLEPVFAEAQTKKVEHKGGVPPFTPQRATLDLPFTETHLHNAAEGKNENDENATPHVAAPPSSGRAPEPRGKAVQGDLFAAATQTPANPASPVQRGQEDARNASNDALSPVVRSPIRNADKYSADFQEFYRRCPKEMGASPTMFYRLWNSRKMSAQDRRDALEYLKDYIDDVFAQRAGGFKTLQFCSIDTYLRQKRWEKYALRREEAAHQAQESARILAENQRLAAEYAANEAKRRAELDAEYARREVEKQAELEEKRKIREAREAENEAKRKLVEQNPEAIYDVQSDKILVAVGRCMMYEQKQTPSYESSVAKIWSELRKDIAKFLGKEHSGLPATWQRLSSDVKRRAVDYMKKYDVQITLELT